MPTNPKSIKCVGTNYAMESPRYHCHWDFMPSWILRHVDDMYVFVYYYYFLHSVILLFLISPLHYFFVVVVDVCVLVAHTHTHTRIHSPMDLSIPLISRSTTRLPLL